MTGEAEESSYFISEEPKPWQWNTTMRILSGCDWFVVSSYNEKSLKCSDEYLIFLFFFCINGAIAYGEHKRKWPLLLL